MIKRLPGKEYGTMFGSISQQINAVPYQGKKIILRAAARIDAAGGDDKAYLRLRVIGPGYRRIIGERMVIDDEWSGYEIPGEVSMDAIAIEYMFAYAGDGACYIDSVALEQKAR